MSKKTTKRSLLASVFALVLCVAMLVGSTFAWFTDTATTGVNKITSGKLDVKLSYLTDDNEWKEVTKDTQLFDNNALWEPGHTEVAYLKVENAGSLALKPPSTSAVPPRCTSRARSAAAPSGAWSR